MANDPADEVNTDGGLHHNQRTCFCWLIYPLTKRSIIELLPTPLSPRSTILYFSSAIPLFIYYAYIYNYNHSSMNEQHAFSLEALIFLLVLAVYVLASYFIDKYKVAFLHESTIAICLGFLTALLLKLVRLSLLRPWEQASSSQRTFSSHYCYRRSYFQ